MELFCLGEGNYSEADVLELARCFTGWEIKSGKFRKNRYQHDMGVKDVLHQSGNFDGEDGVRIVLEQPSAERFLARKLYCFFVSDEPEPTEVTLQPLAEAFRKHELQVAPVLKMILGSNLFFSSYAVGRKIKSPVRTGNWHVAMPKGDHEYSTNCPRIDEYWPRSLLPAQC